MHTISMALVALAAFAGAASAQQATEQFIPIGQSPGAVTMQGELSAAVAPAAVGGETSFSMMGADAQQRSYAIGPRTRIYIDRSALGQPNTMGSAADLRAGRAIEVSVADPAARVALWIKVRAEP